MTDHRNAGVWILCNQKARGNSSHNLYRHLQAIGVNCYRVTAGNRPRYSPSRVHTIINWGVSRQPIWYDDLRDNVKWLNRTATVVLSTNKLLMQEHLGTLGLAWTWSKYQAEQEILEGRTIVSRGILNGSQGRGITLSPPDPLPEAELYTVLFEGNRVREYRVYIVDGKAIDITEKRRMNRERREELGIDGRDPYTRLVRAHRNGWVFARNTMQANEDSKRAICERAEQAAKRFELGIGAVDMIASFEEGDASVADVIKVVETNTMVGIQGDGATAGRLANAIKEAL
jgi:hypothetical protein